MKKVAALILLALLLTLVPVFAMAHGGVHVYSDGVCVDGSAGGMSGSIILRASGPGTSSNQCSTTGQIAQVP